MAEIAFGLFDHVERTEVPLQELYEGRMKLLEAADAAGFYCYHVAEHQATPLGMAPSPGILLGAVAQRTRRIHLGPLVYLLPLYNPLRLISEIGMLDQMSGGRMEIGVGRGISPYELAYYRVPFYDSREMFEEALSVVAAGLRSPRLTHRGHYYHYSDVPIEVRVKQSPNPPFWYGCATDESVTFAARRNMHMVGNGPIPMLKRLTTLYCEVQARYRDSELNLNPQLPLPRRGAIRHIFVGETDQEAQAIARPAYRAFYDNLMKLWRDNRVVLPQFAEDLERARKIDVVMVGSPSTVRAEVERFFESSGCNYLVLAFAWGNLGNEQARRSLELFASEVMPAFQRGGSALNAAAS
jgi:alkanesulfonate monooxygenase SsuD/methylene tetrahydromethanopterin reductase-like flavin-dependent oxidoreductase (luciferase family)